MGNRKQARRIPPEGARLAFAQLALGISPRAVAMQLIQRDREHDLPRCPALRLVIYHAKLRTYRYRPSAHALQRDTARHDAAAA